MAGVEPAPRPWHGRVVSQLHYTHVHTRTGCPVLVAGRVPRVNPSFPQGTVGAALTVTGATRVQQFGRPRAPDLPRGTAWLAPDLGRVEHLRSVEPPVGFEPT